MFYATHTPQPGVQNIGQPNLAGENTPKRHTKRNMLLIFLLVVLVYSLVETAAATYRGFSQLSIHIGDQQAGVLNLDQGLVAVSPYLLGANAFPQAGSDSLDQPASGFMSYATPVSDGLLSAHVRLLRFPGGNWGEQHQLAPAQLDAFAQLLTQTHADGIMQVPLSNPVGLTQNLDARAGNAALLVDYMNNKQSIQRANAQAPFHPIPFWTVGNEPDLLINPDTTQKYTVDKYVEAFVQYSIKMHKIDPTIKVFGPEISQYGGPAKDPTDTEGKHWMADFLEKVSTFERRNPPLGFHLLDGVSFHRYPLTNASQARTSLLDTSNEWDTSIPALRLLIRQDFQRELPIAVTEVNTNPTNQVPQPGVAALWWADTLGRLMSQQTEFVAFFSVEGVDTPYPLFSTHDLQETPMLRTMLLFAKLQHNFVPLQIALNPVGVYATQDDAHQTVSLLFVNKSTSSQRVTISPGSGFLPIGPFSPWHGLNVTLQGSSIVVVTLHRNGGAESDSFVTDNQLNAAPLAHTVCSDNC